MNNESYIRSEIRKYLLEYSNIGADNGEELEYSPESIEDLIAVAQQRKKDQEKSLNSLKKQQGIQVHPDKSINTMMKKTDKTKMDGIEDEIESTDDQEEELGRVLATMGKMNQQNKDYKDRVNQMSQTSSQVDLDSSITNT